MKQWYTCSNCDYESKEFPKEMKIKELEAQHGTHCPVCGDLLCYNAG